MYKNAHESAALVVSDPAINKSSKTMSKESSAIQSKYMKEFRLRIEKIQPI